VPPRERIKAAMRALMLDGQVRLHGTIQRVHFQRRKK
jgi:hypothetical protein